MDEAIKQRVRERAGLRCEYCHLPQEFSALRFHVEHVVAHQHGGADSIDNLALACPDCNFHKGTNLTGIDPDSGRVTRLFDPRSEVWNDHFARDAARIIGKTPVGRTTAWLLEMNAGDRVRWRELISRLRKLD